MSLALLLLQCFRVTISNISRVMVAGRQTFATWIQRLPQLSSAHPSLDQNALWLRPSLPAVAATLQSMTSMSSLAVAVAGGKPSREMEAQTETSLLDDSHNYSTSSGIGESPFRRLKNTVGAVDSAPRGFLPSPTSRNRHVNHSAAAFEISFVDEEDEEGDYGYCDDERASSSAPLTDLDRLLDAPPDAVWDISISHPGYAGNTRQPRNSYLGPEGTSQWTVSETTAASFGVVTITDVSDMVML